MENTNLDRKKVIKEMESLKAKRIDDIKRMLADQGETQVDEQNLNEAIAVKYLGKMEFVNEQGELTEKDVFIMVEEHSGQFQIRYYDEDQKLLGIQRTLDEDIIPSGEMLGKLPEDMKNIEKEDIEEAKTLEELEEEQKQEEEQKPKEEKIAEDLSEKMEKPELEVSSYIKIMDNSFLQEYPETCEGSKEIGIATLSDGTTMLISDYGNGFEMARGTEPAKPTSEEVYDIDRQQQTVERKSPNARINITGNGYKPNSKFLSLTYDESGAPKIQSVDVAPDNTMVGRDIRTQGDDASKEKSSDEYQLEREQGEEAATNISDLVSGEHNEDNDEMKQQMVEEVLQSHREELESLYGDEVEQEAAVRRYIEEATTRRGIIVPEEIQQFVEGNIEEDYEMTILRGRREH